MVVATGFHPRRKLRGCPLDRGTIPGGPHDAWARWPSKTARPRAGHREDEAVPRTGTKNTVAGIYETTCPCRMRDAQPQGREFVTCPRCGRGQLAARGRTQAAPGAWGDSQPILSSPV
jgi:hypothetical protein